MKKLVVTGGAGFIGSEFVRQAVAKGYRIHVIDNLTYAGDLARLAEVRRKITFHKVDVLNVKAVVRIVKTAKPDVIVHFAAETHVDRSIFDGYKFLQTNILGTQVLLEAARLSDNIKFVYISTDEVYGDVTKGCSSEGDAFHPNSPYSVSKASADMLVSAYARTYQLPVSIVRASNNYGPWQHSEKFVPVVINKALRNERIPVYAEGRNIREWLFVSDCACGIMAVMERGRAGEAYNLGSGVRRCNIDLVRAILKLTGKPEKLVRFVADRPGHDFRYSMDSSKALRELDWQPQYTFARGLAKTVDWYRVNGGFLR